MTIEQAISIQYLIRRLSEADQTRFYDAVTEGRPVPDDIRKRLEELDAQMNSGGPSMS